MLLLPILIDYWLGVLLPPILSGELRVFLEILVIVIHSDDTYVVECRAVEFLVHRYHSSSFVLELWSIVACRRN